MQFGPEVAHPFQPPFSLQNVVENEQRVDHLPSRLLVAPGDTHGKPRGLVACSPEVQQPDSLLLFNAVLEVTGVCAATQPYTGVCLGEAGALNLKANTIVLLGTFSPLGR